MNLSEDEMGTLEESGLYLRIGTAMALIGSVVAGAVLGVGCGMPPYDESAVEAMLNNAGKPILHETIAGGRTMYYAETGSPTKPLIVFIHGTPGSWRGFGQYLADESLRRRAHLIAVDRPGFGRSEHEQLVTSLSEQAAFICQFLQRDFTGRRAILVGHSLGASIAARLAMDQPDLVEGLVLVAPSIDPKLEKPRWYNHLADNRFVRWVLPNDLSLANQEVMPLYGELSQMLPLWQRLSMPVIVIQGGKDRLTSPANADFAVNVLGTRARIIRVPQAGHFIIWKQPAIIVDAILSLLEKPGHPRVAAD